MTSVRAYVDRIEDDIAVLLLGDQEERTIHFPVAFLPAQTREGAVLRLNLAADREDEEQTTRQVDDLRGRLMHRGPTHDDYED